MVSPLEPGYVVAGKYRLERPIARGGMGAVWAARHVQLDSTVAIKFMDPALAQSESARARFEREAKSAAALRSPHVVQIFDHGVDQDTPFIAMELLEGEDLGSRLQRDYRLNLQDASRILAQTAKGLQRAHDMGIVHRDLKPRNIFLARSEDGDVVKILDFGVAKVQGSAGDTKTGELVGSPHFMSPEQAHGAKAVDHRSDLWSLGVILFRAITGERPFRGDGIGDVIVQICTRTIPPPSGVAKDLSPEIDAFFKRALDRDPAKRFQSAREMSAEFAALAGLSLSALDPSYPRLPAPPATPSSPSSGRQSRASISGSGIHGATPPHATPLPASIPSSSTVGVETPTSSDAERPHRRDLRPAFIFGGVTVGVVVLGLLVSRVGSAPAPAAAAPPSAQAAALVATVDPPASAAPVAEPSASPPPSSAPSASVAAPKKTAAPVAPAPPKTTTKRPSLGY